MFSKFKHIFCFLFVAVLMMSVASCTSWREAKAVVKEADSLLVKGVIIKDTAALSGGICTLENLMGRVFAKEELTKMYYLMGGNLDDYYHNFSDAADFYIKADRMKTKDWVLRGRINSCMGFICKQDSSFAEALEFYERANNAFEKTGDKRRVANGLVSIAEQYVNLKDYSKADSVLNIAAGYDIDSAYYARVVDVYALALYNQQLYDSALVLLLGIKDYPRNIDARCYSYMKIMRLYNKLNNSTNSIYYAKYIITHSNNPSFLSNAYYHLVNYAKDNNDMDDIFMYSHLREDEDRKLQHVSESYAQATLKLKDYLRNPCPFLYLWITGGFVILLGGAGIWIYRRKSEQVIAEKHQMEAELRNWKESIQQKLDRDKEDIMNEKRMIIRNIIMEYADEFAIGKPIWDNDTKLFRLADSCFGFIIYRLKHTYHLRNSELKICLMVLLDFPNKEIARIVSYKEDSYPTIKRRLATKLGTSSTEMRNFLLDLIVKIL